MNTAWSRFKYPPIGDKTKWRENNATCTKKTPSDTAIQAGKSFQNGRSLQNQRCQILQFFKWRGRDWWSCWRRRRWRDAAKNDAVETGCWRGGWEKAQAKGLGLPRSWRDCQLHQVRQSKENSDNGWSGDLHFRWHSRLPVSRNRTLRQPSRIQPTRSSSGFWHLLLPRESDAILQAGQVALSGGVQVQTDALPPFHQTSGGQRTAAASLHSEYWYSGEIGRIVGRTLDRGSWNLSFSPLHRQFLQKGILPGMGQG